MTALLHRDLKSNLPIVVKGEGSYLFDAKNNKYLDACGGAAVASLGHSHPKVLKAIKAQLDDFSFAHTGFFTNNPAEQLALKLQQYAPKGFENARTMFLGSGSEAMEAAIKLARQFHLENGEASRTKLISREFAYHGNTLAALAVGGHPERRKPFLPLLLCVGRIPACYAYREQQDFESEEQYGIRAANYLEAEILRLGADTVAAFTVEPVSGATLGSVVAAKGYFKRIREICDQYGVLLIADEVMCGMGRTGTMFAIEQEGITPDIITMAKGLAAGYQPLAAVMASDKVVNVILSGSGKLWNGHTYMSHAVACAGALAVLNVIEEENLLENVNVQGKKLAKALKQEFSNRDYIGDIRGRGLFWSLELVQNKRTKQPFDAALGLAAKFKSKAFENGLLTYPASGFIDGKLGDHVLLAPPYNVSDAEISEIIKKLAITFDQIMPVLANEGQIND
ncbi:MAG: aspartate aminotransferase family protein [Hyphomicrobiales bacterium]|nr:MAG: aspartate aminotransferase family protein [Hyphomicrobiales bacterium]